MKSLFAQEIFNLQLLDQAVAMHSNASNSSQLNEAEEILSTFFNRDEELLYLEDILKSDCHIDAKIFTLITLSSIVCTNWFNIRVFIREKIKNILYSIVFQDSYAKPIIKLSSELIVKILKFDYPELWPSFFEDIFNYGKTSPEACNNVMEFIITLSNELNSKDKESNILNQQLSLQIRSYIWNFNELVLMSFDQMFNVDLVNIAIVTTSHLLKWAEPSVFLQSRVFNKIIKEFINEQEYKNASISVLSEVLSKLVIPHEFHLNIPRYFELIVNSLPNNFDNDGFLNINSLINAMITIFIDYDIIISTNCDKLIIIQILEYILDITKAENFCYCIDFWRKILQKILFNGLSKLRNIFLTFSHQLRVFMIENMPSPYDPPGNVDEFCKYSSLFLKSRECLVYLCSLDKNDTMEIIFHKCEEMDSFIINETAQHIYWSIGCLSGCFSNDEENNFMITLISKFKSICFQKELSFVYSQYCKFLIRIWSTSFVKDIITNIINNILNFIDDEEEEEYALVAFKQLAIKLGLNLSFVHNKEEHQTIIEEILKYISDIFTEIPVCKVPKVLEILSIIINDCKYYDDKPAFYSNLLAVVAKHYGNLLKPEFLFNPENIEQNQLTISFIDCLRKVSISSCEIYFDKIQETIPVCIQIYLKCQSFLKISTNFNIISSVNEVMLSIIHLYNHVLGLNNSFQITVKISDSLIPVIINDFETSCEKKQILILKLFSTILIHQGMIINQLFDDIFEILYKTTSKNIHNDLLDHQELCLEAFTLMNNLCKFSCSQLISMDEDQFSLFMEDLKFGSSNISPKISELAINSYVGLFNSVYQQCDIADYTALWTNYGFQIVLGIFSMLNNITYKYSFEIQVDVLYQMLVIEESPLTYVDIESNVREMFQDKSPNEIEDFLTVLEQILSHELDDYLTFRKVIKNLILSDYPSQQDKDCFDMEEKQRDQIMLDTLKQIPGYITPNDEQDSLPEEDGAVNDLIVLLSSLNIE